MGLDPGSSSDDLHYSKSPTSQKLIMTSPTKQGLYDGLEGAAGLSGAAGFGAYSLTSKLGLALPNPAPDVDMAPTPFPESSAQTAATVGAAQSAADVEAQFEDPDEPKKKKG